MANARSRKSSGTARPRRKSTRESATALVLYVHGIGPQPGPEDLKREWDIALFGRDLGEQSRLAYWADILHGEDRKLEPVSSRSVTSELDVEEVLSSAGLTGSNVDAEVFADRLLEVLDATSSPNSPRKKILPLPGFLRKA